MAYPIESTQTIDSETWSNIQSRITTLVQDASKRNDMFKAMKKRYLMEWEDEDRVKRIAENIKITKSPRSRNALVGAHRLLTTTIPSFKVDGAKNKKLTGQQRDGLETLANGLLNTISEVRRHRLEKDVALSMLLFDECQILVTRTEDLLAFHTEAGAARYQAEEVAGMTPYMLDVVDPESGYYELGPYGLTAYYREVATTCGDVWDEFGEAARKVIPGDNRFAEVTLCTWWDHVWHIVSVKGGGMIVCEKHKLKFIPVIVQVGSGSTLFDKLEERHQPFLFADWKAQLHERQNLMLTAMNTNLFAYLANATFWERVNQQGKHLNVDMSVPGFRITLEPGEEFGQVQKTAVDPQMVGALEQLDTLLQESTIYSQTLGEPIGDAPFAALALLHQAGRLPLSEPKDAAAWAIADAIKLCLRWMRDEPTDTEYYGALEQLGQAQADIPEHFTIECVMEVSLPQDKLQSANVAKLLKGTVSERWIREELMNIGNNTQMQHEVWSEQAANAMVALYFQMMVQKSQQAQNPPPQEQVPPEMAAGQPGPESMPPEGMTGMPNEMAQGPMAPGMEGQMQGGAPMLPPEMGGGLPPGVGG